MQLNVIYFLYQVPMKDKLKNIYFLIEIDAIKCN